MCLVMPNSRFKKLVKESLKDTMPIQKKSVASNYTHRLSLYQVNDLIDFINNDKDREKCVKEVNDILSFRGYRERFEINEETGRVQMKMEEE